MEISVDAIQRFFRARAGDLRRIMRGTRGDVELGDVQSEAYVIATEIQAGRGYAFDFDSPGDQDTLLGGLWNRLVKFAERNFRTAVALDEPQDGEEVSPGAVVARSLSAPETSDPLVLMEQEEDAAEEAERLYLSYSEAVAYVLLLRRFRDDKTRLAKYLQVVLSTLQARMQRAGRVAQVQPSVFDGVERISSDFLPTIDKPRREDVARHLTGEQWAWGF